MAKKMTAKKPNQHDTSKGGEAVLGTASDSATEAESVEEAKLQIERIDREIVKLLGLRGRAVERLWQISSGTLPTAGTVAQESEASCRALGWNEGPLSDQCVRAVFRELASGCQQLVQSLRVAYLGPEFSYSYLAAVHRFGQCAELLPLANIAAVFESVGRGDVAFGLVPLENSTDGRIVDTLDMFAKMPIRISGEVQLRVHHNLLAKCDRRDVKQVCSKPQALSQCRNWLAKHLPAAKIVETASTTAAAESAAKQPGVAAIASHQAAVNYGLNVLAAQIEDNPNNITRFAVIGHTSSARTGDDITSLMFELPHRPGALADAMAIFKRNRLNLTWIESFPLQGSSNEYLFFVELEGHETELRVRRAIASLRRKTERLDVLGSYRRSGAVE